MKTKKSLLVQLALMYALVIVCMLACGAALVYTQVYRSMRDQQIDYGRDSLRGILKSSESLAEHVESCVNIYANDESILQLLNDSGESLASRVIRQQYDVLKTVNEMRAFLSLADADVILYANDTSVPVSFYSVMHATELEKDADYLAFVSGKASFAWTGVGCYPYAGGIFSEGEPLFVGYRKILRGIGQQLGVFRCAIRPGHLFEVIDQWDDTNAICVMIDGTFFYGDASAACDVRGSGYHMEQDSLYVYESSAYLGCQLVFRTDAGALRNNVLKTCIPQFAIIVMVGMILWIVSGMVLKSTIRRLRCAIGYAEEACTEGLLVRFPEDGDDEVGKLIRLLNVLLDRMEGRRRAEQQAQICALQYQMNPHFLFNTLSWLQMCADAPEAHEQLGPAIVGLSSLLRYNLSGEPFALLSQELDNLRTYVALMNLRKGNRITLEVNSPEEVLPFRVCRFLLQPLAENAIRHGMGPHTDYLHIAVKIERTDNQLRIGVFNDGKPIPVAKLNALNQQLSNGIRDAGIGLGNIASRLRLHYSATASIALRLADGCTQIWICIPVNSCKED